MPTEPPASPWEFPDPTAAPDDLVAFGADLEPGTLLAAYRGGYFPMPVEGELGWWSPRHRGVLPLDGLRVSRSLRRSRRRFEVRVDTAFADVVAACGAPDRDGGAWIDAEMAAAYLRLHEAGWAHSVEAWRDGCLVGGLYGVAIGGLFAGESMFHHETDASKVALCALVDLLSDEHRDRRLLDVQWRTHHLASLGVVELPRPAYLTRLAAALALPAAPIGDRRESGAVR
ncbi:leucyl/phenylalanyl-tRNA--protein transferase [Nocardioides donggukensis]|uniref:Leucyl/phenylalanyl-tRNA--protein transferase n=1 Tax=Nocardioides donggukensis TaxID=2774019 RepID=A0A927K360_9ACTN|nr:leucyl/phenylalanyl-tRNA--protein transferase [Nocardioides donggukensis]MBD8868085.1 leucyl/phenylalanyl-tRNA--protein transferase [Nocardioides donggukensis]